MIEEEMHKCTTCSCEFTDDEGGVQGNFGILPMSFCPTCLSCMLDMADQLNPQEWVGLTSGEIEKEWFAIFDAEPGIGKNITNGVFKFAQTIEVKLKQKNYG